MNKRRFASRGGSGRAVRPMDWECSQLSTSLAANTRTCDWAVDPETLKLYTDPTLMATRQFSQMESWTDSFSPYYEPAAIGIIAWDSIEQTFPPLECPDPLRDCDMDWIVRIVGFIAPFALAGFAPNPNIFDNTHLSKAKRRLGSQTGILVCFAAGLGSGAPGVDFGIDVRCLIKE